MKKLFFILSVFLFAYSAFADCVPYDNFRYDSGKSYNACVNNIYPFLSNVVCSGGPLKFDKDGISRCYFYGGAAPSDCGSTYNGCTVYFDCKQCSNSCEVDSLKCVQSGNSWDILGTSTTCGGKGCKSCDTTMSCVSYPFNRCVDVPAASEITCVNGECSGLPGSMWWSEFRNECSNECGDMLTSSVMSDTAFVVGASCDDDVKCGSETYCGEFDNGTYFLYKKCLAGRETVGNVNEQQSFAQIEYSGKGTCAGNGYKSSKYSNSGSYAQNAGGAGGGASSGDSPQDVPDNCVLYGIGCESYQDTTDYSDPNNQSPNKNCWCEPLDGLNNMSRIVCPDGSIRVGYFSCNEWHKMFSSSSASSPGGSSASGGGSSGSTTNSSDSNPFQGKYPEYPTDQPTTNKNTQAALSGSVSLLSQIKDKLVEIKNYLVNNDNESYKFDSVALSHGDYSQLDSVNISSPAFSFDSIFSIVDTSRKLIDTSKYVAPGTCPIITGRFSSCKYIPFFKNNEDVDLKFDFSNMAGINLCTLIKSIVIAFASVVSTLISLKVFLKSGL